jgi:hypothetical protein
MAEIMNEGYRSSPRRWSGVLLAAAALAALLSIGACSRAAATSDGAATVATLGPSPSPASPTTAATAKTEPPVPQHSATTHPSPAATSKQVSNPGYSTALAQWKKGATAISAQQGVYWLAAAGLLQAAESTDSGNTSGYQVAANELRDLATLPDAQQTPAQNAEYHHDIDALNSFFNTPGLYS